MESCPNCDRQISPGMGFCPGCGMNLSQAAGPAPVMGRGGTYHFQGPSPGVYPMPYMPQMPYPAMPRPPMTVKRAAAIGGGILMIIAACFTFIAGLVFLLGWWWWADYWIILGILSLVAFGLGIAGAVGVFRRSWRLFDLGAAIFLVVLAILSLWDMPVLGVLDLILSIIALVLIAVAWGQFDELQGYQHPYAPMPTGPAPGGAPAPPAPGPQRVPGPDDGPPPLVVPSWEEGAPPPPVGPLEVDEVML